MRRRDLSPAFFSSQQVIACSPFARLLFEGLWCLADREGRLVDDPWRIKLSVLPYDPIDADALLGELAANGLVARYTAEGTRCIEVTGFGTHQNIHPHERASVLPPPRNDMSLHVDTSPTMSAHVIECTPGTSGTSVTSGTSGRYIASPNGEAPPTREVSKVWETWLEATGRTRCKLDAQRRGVIQRAIRSHGMDDVLDAVRGWINDPWEERRLHTDVTVLLRNAVHIEKFRDLWRHPPAKLVTASRYEDPLASTLRHIAEGREERRKAAELAAKEGEA